MTAGPYPPGDPGPWRRVYPASDAESTRRDYGDGWIGHVAHIHGDVYHPCIQESRTLRVIQTPRAYRSRATAEAWCDRRHREVMVGRRPDGAAR